MLQFVNKIFLGALIVVIVVLAGPLGYFIFQNQKLVKTIQNASPATQTPKIETQANQAESPTSQTQKPLTLKEVQDQVTASLNSANYQALGTFMNASVQFILMSTECCGQITKQEALDQMSYIDGGQPFNFDQNNQLIKNVKTKNFRLANTFVGISQNGEQLAAFKFDQDNKISSIELAISHKLYDL